MVNNMFEVEKILRLNSIEKEIEYDVLNCSSAGIHSIQLEAMRSYFRFLAQGNIVECYFSFIVFLSADGKKEDKPLSNFEKLTIRNMLDAL